MHLDDGVDDVRGRIDGRLSASGTTLDPRFGGSLTLRDGSASYLISGVDYRDVAATVKLENKKTARIEATGKASDGTANVTGTIDLTHPRDPGFALTMNAQNFLAAKRRDAEFAATGTVRLGGRFRQPVVTGEVAVDQGALFLDEFPLFQADIIEGLERSVRHFDASRD